MKIIEIQDRTPHLIQELIRVWESSVRATQLFLSQREIEEIKGNVRQSIVEIPSLLIVENDDRLLIAFMGLEKEKLRMLYVANEARGKGNGRLLLTHGIDNYQIRELTVNEQNPLARGFYEHMGFKVYDRSELDEQGYPYPILFMRLS